METHSLNYTSDTDIDDVFMGPITKREIVARLKFYKILSEEYLAPIDDLTETDVVDDALVSFYWNIFDCRENMASENQTQNKSMYQDLEQRRSLYNVQPSEENVSIRRDNTPAESFQNEEFYDSINKSQISESSIDEEQDEYSIITISDDSFISNQSKIENFEHVEIKVESITKDETEFQDLQNPLSKLKLGEITEIKEHILHVAQPIEMSILSDTFISKNSDLENYYLPSPRFYEENPSIHEEIHSFHEENPSFQEENPCSHEENPSYEENPNSHEENPSSHEEIPNSHEKYPSSHEETPSFHEENPSFHEENPSSHEENPSYEENPSFHEENNKFHEENPSFHEENSSIQEQNTSFNDTLQEMEMLMKFGENYMEHQEDTIYRNQSNISETFNETEEIYEKISKKQIESPSCSKYSYSPILKENTSEIKENTPKILKPDNSTENHFKIPTNPLSTKKSPNYKNIVSPISLYIKNSPKVPLMKKISTPSIHTASYREINNKKHEEERQEKVVQGHQGLPIRTYKLAAKNIFLSKENEPHLPNNIRKLMKGPLNPEIIKHVGRVKATTNFSSTPSTNFSNNADLTMLSSTSASEGIFNVSTNAEGDVSLYISKNAARTNFSTK